MAERGQTLTVSIECTRPMTTDSARLQRALEELLDNASRFSPPGAAIDLSVIDDPGGVTFRVADTGPGMTPRKSTWQAGPSSKSICPPRAVSMAWVSACR